MTRYVAAYRRIDSASALLRFRARCRLLTPQPTMVELQPIFRKAYWTLVAGGLAYVLFVTALTFPGVQRLYDTLVRGMNR